MAEVERMLKTQAAARLGVTKARVSQLIRDGHLRPDDQGLITAQELQRFKREAPIKFQHPGCRSGRRSAAQQQADAEAARWSRVAFDLYQQGWKLLPGREMKRVWQELNDAVAVHFE